MSEKGLTSRMPQFNSGPAYHKIPTIRELRVGAGGIPKAPRSYIGRYGFGTIRRSGRISLVEYSVSRQVNYRTLVGWLKRGLPCEVDPVSRRKFVDAKTADIWAARHTTGLAFRRRSFVYFAQAPGGGSIKIGYSSELARRLKELDCVALATFPGNQLDERELHARFEHIRVDGEWFQPTPELLDFIAELASTARVAGNDGEGR